MKPSEQKLLELLDKMSECQLKEVLAFAQDLYSRGDQQEEDPLDRMLKEYEI